MTEPLCDRSPLVEASFDDRLGPSERVSLERHLATCTACATERRELERLRSAIGSLHEEITPLAHQRARLGLLRRAAAPVTERASSRRRVAVLAVALVLLPAAVWGALSTMTPPPSPSPAALTPPMDPPVVTSVVRPVAPVETVTAEPPPPPPPVIVAPRPEPRPVSHASRDFADAMDTIARGDFGAGAAKLDRFARENPSDPRAEEALYLEAIAFERAGRSAEARSAATRYLATYPDGAHRTRVERLAESDRK